MSNTIKTQSTQQKEPTARRKEWKRRIPAAFINAGVALLIAACGNDDKAPAHHDATPSANPSSTTVEKATPIPEITTPASPATEAAPSAALQEQMTARAEQHKTELGQSILSFAATLSPDAAPVEDAQNATGANIQYARVDVPGADGTSTHYEMYTKYTDPGAGLDIVIENINIEVDYKDAAGNTTDIPYGLSVWQNPAGPGQMLTLTGSGEGGPFAISDDFSGAPGLNTNERPILTLADEEAVFAQANEMFERARNGEGLHDISSPF